MSDKPVRIGIIGAGGIVRSRHMPGLAKLDGVSVAAVCNRRRSTAEQFAKDFDVADVHDRWQEVVDSHADKIYHNVLKRFWAGAEVSTVGFERMRRGLDQLAARLHARLAGAAAMVMPTNLTAPPPIAPLEADDDAYVAANLASLHNTTLGNVLKTCAVTLPCGGTGGAGNDADEAVDDCRLLRPAEIWHQRVGLAPAQSSGTGKADCHVGLPVPGAVFPRCGAGAGRTGRVRSLRGKQGRPGAAHG